MRSDKSSLLLRFVITNIIGYICTIYFYYFFLYFLNIHFYDSFLYKEVFFISFSIFCFYQFCIRALGMLIIAIFFQQPFLFDVLITELNTT